MESLNTSVLTLPRCCAPGVLGLHYGREEFSETRHLVHPTLSHIKQAAYHSRQLIRSSSLLLLSRIIFATFQSSLRRLDSSSGSGTVPCRITLGNHIILIASVVIHNPDTVLLATMRLLLTDTGEFVEINNPIHHVYAILSHTWRREGEQSYRDILEIQRSLGLSTLREHDIGSARYADLDSSRQSSIPHHQMPVI